MEAALEYLAGSSISLSSIITMLFEEPGTYNHHGGHICLQDLHRNINRILNTLTHNASTRQEVLDWTTNIAKKVYCKELTSLTNDESMTHYTSMPDKQLPAKSRDLG
jgi:hypothetical protein